MKIKMRTETDVKQSPQDTIQNKLLTKNEVENEGATSTSNYYSKFSQNYQNFHKIFL